MTSYQKKKKNAGGLPKGPPADPRLPIPLPDGLGRSLVDEARAALEVFARKAGVPLQDLTGQGRHRRTVALRRQAILWIREAYPTLTLAETGALFGGRHHTSILYHTART